ncbi:MAG: hypothetical protein MK212_07330 [Saprospiraceae bacterium]|nr:hypothetical protein [Saprospiraceae bacterium]
MQVIYSRNLFLIFIMMVGSMVAQAQFVNLEDTWKEFLANAKTSNILDLQEPNKREQPKDYLKYCLMHMNTNFCAGNLKEAQLMINRIEDMDVALQDQIPNFKEKKEDLKTKLGAAKKAHKVWERFQGGENISLEELDEHKGASKVCEKGTLAKYTYMELRAHYCNGDLEKSQGLFNNRLLKLINNTSLKVTDVDGLETEVEMTKNLFGGLPKLEKAWKKYLDTDKSEGYKDDLPLIECNAIPSIKICILRAAEDVCLYGPQMYKKIQNLQKKNTRSLPSDVKDRLDWLKGELDKSNVELADLEESWTLFKSKHTANEWPELPAVDTVLGDQVKLVDFYCDKIAQTKSWVIKGSLDACAEGQGYLDKIDALKKEHNLEYDKDLACQVLRFRGKVYQCRYWELVLQARKETHEERERFGPESSKIMYGDLNSDKLPCETTVEYEPLGYIGVKYVITAYLCQRINLAKMGDPEYYKKIATWVGTQVLDRYCEKDMRCKEDFFIYLEGHTDGHRFDGRKYDNVIGIPAGTPYTHFVDGDTLKKTVEEEITDRLSGNMDLGLARAWSVKQQLDFMKVPITIGAYEHPEKEKGGEFRRIEIQLNITNLLLDFYEKRLKELVKESGIGDRPPKC